MPEPGERPVADLAGHVADYLRLRRALGFKLTAEGRLLPQLVDYLAQAGASTLTGDLAITWAGLPHASQPISLAHRLGAARGFARYLQTIDPQVQVPPTGIWATHAARPTPYLWSPIDISRLLRAAGALPGPFRAATHQTLLGVLAVTGMRVGEALGLACRDVDLDGGVLRVREAKHHRERLVPLHPDTTDRLREYAGRPDRPTAARCRSLEPASFFVARTGSAVTYSNARNTFAALTSALGLRTASVQPRIHDLRHSFAVRTLIGWHRQGADVTANLPVLSTYLGHRSPAGTYWYLSAAPELMELAAAHLNAHLDARAGGRP